MDDVAVPEGGAGGAVGREGGGGGADLRAAGREGGAGGADLRLLLVMEGTASSSGTFLFFRPGLGSGTSLVAVELSNTTFFLIFLFPVAINLRGSHYIRDAVF